MAFALAANLDRVRRIDAQWSASRDHITSDFSRGEPMNRRNSFSRPVVILPLLGFFFERDLNEPITGTRGKWVGRRRGVRSTFASMASNLRLIGQPLGLRSRARRLYVGWGCPANLVQPCLERKMIAPKGRAREIMGGPSSG